MVTCTIFHNMFASDLQLMSIWTNKQTKTLFCKLIERFDHGSVKIRNGDFQTGFFGAERDKTLVMTGIHKWSHAQYFTTRLHLIFNCTLSSVELRQQRHAWPKLECPETFFLLCLCCSTFCFVTVGEIILPIENDQRPKQLTEAKVFWCWYFDLDHQSFRLKNELLVSLNNVLTKAF